MPRLKEEVVVHLQKARESAFLAVETYNRPRSPFRSGGYIVLMVIAWTALFHAIYLQRGTKPFYRRKNNRRHFERIDGDKKAWELSTCMAQFWGDQNPAMRSNLEFFVRLRNKIEHRSMPGLDLEIFGECQALLFNFEEILSTNFGARLALNESLSLALQFSCSRNEEQATAIRKLHSRLAKDIRSYVDSFRSSLAIEQIEDLRYSYKVFLIPKPANRPAGADLAVEFVKYDPNNKEEADRINRAITLLKPTTADKIGVGAEVANGSNAAPFRITNDETAPAVRALNPDATHPYRQKDLLARLIQRLPEGIEPTTHDLLCVREVNDVKRNANYFYQSRFGPCQYSDLYLNWLLDQFATNENFFSEAKIAYAAMRRTSS